MKLHRIDVKQKMAPAAIVCSVLRASMTVSKTASPAYTNPWLDEEMRRKLTVLSAIETYGYVVLASLG